MRFMTNWLKSFRNVSVDLPRASNVVKFKVSMMRCVFCYICSVVQIFRCVGNVITTNCIDLLFVLQPFHDNWPMSSRHVFDCFRKPYTDKIFMFLNVNFLNTNFSKFPERTISEKKVIWTKRLASILKFFSFD